VTTSADLASGGAEDPQDCAHDGEDDPDRVQDGRADEYSDQDQDYSENDHCSSPLRAVQRTVVCSFVVIGLVVMPGEYPQE
jgi:hypothetical protein